MIIFADYRRTVANILKSFPRVTKLAEIFAISSPSVFSRRSRHPSSVSREARVGRSGDSARECPVAVLLATSGAGRAITICREKRRARRQWRELTHADLVDFWWKICDFLPIAKFALKNARLYGEIKRPIESSKICWKICQVSSPPASGQSEKNTRDTISVNSQRVNEINGSTMGYSFVLEIFHSKSYQGILNFI